MTRSAAGDSDGCISLAHRLFVRHREVWIAFALTSFAGVLRFWRLPVLPYGFHGDEANVTLDAKRILDHGWIGPWSDLSVGYPIAVNYFMAPFVELFGAGVFGIRLPVAILGTAATPLAYLVFRNVAGWRAGLCGTLLLTVSLWHLHLSRMGIPVIGWPTMELASLLCLQLGMKTRRWWWFVAAGLLLGVGLWIYNAVFIYVAAVGVYLAGWAAIEIYRRRDRTVVRDLLLLAILGGSALLAAKPIIDYQRSPGNKYQGRFDQIYLFSDANHDRCLKVPPEQRDTFCKFAVAESFLDRSAVVRNNLKRFYTHLVVTGYPDSIDGLGAKPPLGKITAYLAMVGAVVALIRYRGKEAVIIGLITIPLLALATALTFDGQYRRAFGMLPFIAMFGGIALGTIWEWADRGRWFVRLPSVALVVAALGVAGYSSLSFYFRDFQENGITRVVYLPEVRGAWDYLDSLDHPYVYYYHYRQSLNYETRLVLAPNIAGGEDRSEEFTTEDKTEPLRFDLAPSARPVQPLQREPDGAVFVFVGTYADSVEDVMQRYPGGQLTERYNEHWKTWDFRAYYLPADVLDAYLKQESVTYPAPAVAKPD